MAVEGGEADAEMISVRLGQLGDVARDVATDLGQEISVAAIEKPLQRCFRGGPGRRNRRVRFHGRQSCRASAARATGLQLGRAGSPTCVAFQGSMTATA